MSVSKQEGGTAAAVQRLQGGLVFKAHRLFYHSTLGLRVMKKKRMRHRGGARGRGEKVQLEGFSRSFIRTLTKLKGL